jgi:6-phosphogluconolactonase
MSLSPVLLGLVLALNSSSKLNVFIGTYTSGQSAKGIYRSTFDTHSGELSRPVLAAIADDPSAIALSSDCRFLFAVHEQAPGSVSAYLVDEQRNLKLVDSQPLQGSYPCDLSVDRQGKYLFVACYTGGFIESLPIGPVGALGAPVSAIQNSGHGPNPGRQEASHMHWVQQGPSGSVYSCDLGTDRVQVYGFDHSNGELTRTEGLSASVPPGDGARHGAFSPNGHFLYVASELGNSVTAFVVNKATGGLSPLQTVEATNAGSRRPGTTTSEIRCDRRGKWVYVSNRGDDSITAFQVLADGRLELIEVENLLVRMPRWFEIDPTGRWIIAAGQDSHDLEVLAIDQSTGRLSPHSVQEMEGSPVCIAFCKGGRQNSK